MQAPTSGNGDKIDLKKVNGALLYFTVHELVKDIQTDYGPSDAIRCDVAVLDGDDKGTIYQDTLIFPSVLRRQLSGGVGSVDPSILGRLGQGVSKKAGQNPPWILADPTEDELAVGVKYEKYAAQQKEAQDAPF